MSSENLLTQIAHFLTLMNNWDCAIYRSNLTGYIQMIKFSSFYVEQVSLWWRKKDILKISNQNIKSLAMFYKSHPLGVWKTLRGKDQIHCYSNNHGIWHFCSTKEASNNSSEYARLKKEKIKRAKF